MRELLERVRRVRSDLAAGLWFIPAMMTAGAALLALLLTRFEEDIDPAFEEFSPWLFRGDGDAAANMLGVIAGSIITVAGVVFSVTMVALVLASTQFSPRVLRGFLRDQVNKIVLGSFIATFTYCLLVMRSTRANVDSVPEVAVTVGVLMALASLGLLILFIHHIGQLVQVANIVQSITRDTVHELEGQYPRHPPASDRWNPPENESAIVRASDFGYVQSIDVNSLVEAASRAEAIIVLTTEPGDFVATSSRIASISPPGVLTAEMENTIRSAFSLGSYPSLSHDVEFGIRQIADIGVKALSPSINDPTTATSCIDHLGVILACAFTRYEPDRLHRDDAGNVRVVGQGPNVEHMLHLAFDQIRHYGRGDRRVLTRMLVVLQQLLELTTEGARVEAIQEMAEQVAQAAERGLEDDDERRTVLDLAREVVAPEPLQQPAG